MVKTLVWDVGRRKMKGGRRTATHPLIPSGGGEHRFAGWSTLPQGAETEKPRQGGDGILG